MNLNFQKKREAFSLIEVIIYMMIVSILFSIVTTNLSKKREEQEFSIEKRNISQFIRKIQQYSQYNKKRYILEFKISENKFYFKENIENKEVILDSMKVSKNISYMTNNSKKNEDFKRHTTNEGNFEKGFTIYLLNKKGNKIFYRIATNTINAAKYPIISIYKAKNPIEINKFEDNYQDKKLWVEEL